MSTSIAIKVCRNDQHTPVVLVAKNMVVGWLRGAEHAVVACSEPVVLHWVHDASVHCGPGRHIARSASLYDFRIDGAEGQVLLLKPQSA